MWTDEEGEANKEEMAIFSATAVEATWDTYEDISVEGIEG